MLAVEAPAAPDAGDDSGAGAQDGAIVVAPGQGDDGDVAMDLESQIVLAANAAHADGIFEMRAAASEEQSDLQAVSAFARRETPGAVQRWGLDPTFEVAQLPSSGQHTDIACRQPSTDEFCIAVARESVAHGFASAEDK